MVEGEGKYTFYPNPRSSSLASPCSLRAASPLPIEGSLALSPPFSLLSLTHLRCKLSFSSFLSRSFCLSCIAVIFQWEIYTTLRYVCCIPYRYGAPCRLAFHRERRGFIRNICRAITRLTLLLSIKLATARKLSPR